MNWPKELRSRIKKQEPLKKHTTFKCGGKAAFFALPQNIEELKLLVIEAKKNRLPIRIIGAGSNILAADKLKKSLVIKLSSPGFTEIKFQGNKVYAGAAAMMPRVLTACRDKGLGGLEFISGVPATAGGAVVMNAGAWGESISNLVERVKVMDYNGKIRDLNTAAIKFTYRDSGLKGYIVLGCTFLLKKISRKKIDENIKCNLTKRKFGQDLFSPSAGCIFKNPDNDSAGRLIDACGFKGKHIGGAQVSEKHANFIINKNKAKPSDILKLIEFVRRQVKKKFRVDLETEIKIWQ